MPTPNEITLESYEQGLEQYAAGTPAEVTGTLQEWLDQSVDGLDSQARIFEIGSGLGRDAAYLESLGYVNVHRTDAAQSFVEHLRGAGEKAEQFNVLDRAYPLQPLDLVLADAVLLHFTDEETTRVCRKTYEALRKDVGRFAFTLKFGEGSEFSDAKLGTDRYFNYWQGDDIEGVLADVGFRDISVDEVMPASTGAPTWLHIIANK